MSSSSVLISITNYDDAKRCDSISGSEMSINAADLEDVGRRLLPNFLTWLVSMLSFCYFDLMLFFNIALAACLRQELCSLPMRQRLQMCHSLQLWFSMNRPPPLPVNDSLDKCSFAAVACDSKSVSETPCCGNRRCAEHCKREYVCNCWVALTSMTRKSGMPEPRVLLKDVLPSRCGVPLRPMNPNCADCREGLIICKHRSECGNPAFEACPGCFRFKCGTALLGKMKCRDFICCGYVSHRAVSKSAEEKAAPSAAPSAAVWDSFESKKDVSDDDDHKLPRADAVMCVNPLLYRAIALLFLSQDLNACAVSSSLQSVPVIVAALRASVAIKHTDQVEHTTHRNNMPMNACARYISLAELCGVFGIDKKASKKDKQAKKIMLTTNEKKERSANSSPSLPSPSSSSGSNSSSPSLPSECTR
jgi:hypothetical protein